MELKIISSSKVNGEMKVDLNCDMGEGFENDELIMPYITSANIACGMHAGDPSVMQKTVQLAKQYGVAVGAHPSWPDLQGFGRREMSFTPDQVESIVIYQIGALAAIAKAEGLELRHVKPHGALYNQAAQDRSLADAIARAVRQFSRAVILVGLAGSGLIEAGVQAGLHVANEGFPDRTYRPDGTLISRKEANAVIESSEDIAGHALVLVRNGIHFGEQRVALDTLCLHGDHIHAAENARLVRDTLEKAGIQISAL